MDQLQRRPPRGRSDNRSCAASRCSKTWAWPRKFGPVLGGFRRSSRPRSARHSSAATSSRRAPVTRPGCRTPGLPVTVTRIETGTVITGRVIGTGLADELRDQRYLLVESRDRLHYIPQPAAVQRARGRGQLRIGDVVTLRGEAIEKGVRVMVETRVQALEPGQGAGGRDGSRPARVPEPARLPTLAALSRSEGRQVNVAEPLVGAIYRGRLVGYGRDRGGRQYAVVDTGRELTAFRTNDLATVPGREVRVQGREHEDDRKRKVLVWRLGDDERERERGQSR